MWRSFRYRVYPLKGQLSALHLHRFELAYLWNFALGQRIDAWVQVHRSISYSEQQRDLTRWRNRDSDGVGRVSVHVAQNCLQRLDLAFQGFFRRVKAGQRPGFPRFKREVDSFGYTPGDHPVVPGPNGTWRVKVPRVGEIPLRLHRPLPIDATVKTVTLRYEAGAWYATFSLKLSDPPPPPLAPPIAPVGVDLGVTHLATLSTGDVVDRPRYIQEGEQRLRKQQRRLARKRRGSHRYHRQRERVARAHARVRQQRRWFAHQLSHDLAQRFDLVSFEGLDASELIEGNPLAKGLSDAGWGMLREMTAYKEAVRSGRCVQVESRGTTQCCSHCSRWADPPLTLEDHTYSCPCGYVADRDGNAARNILARGMTLLSKELRRSTAEVTRVENGPTPARGDRRVYQGRRARSRKREHGIEVGAPFSDSPVRARLRVVPNL